MNNYYYKLFIGGTLIFVYFLTKNVKFAAFAGEKIFYLYFVLF